MVPAEFHSYNVYCHGLKGKNNRGLLVYVAPYLEANVVDVPDAFNESLFLVLELTGTSNRLLLGNIYHGPNSSQDNDNNLYELLDYVEEKF